MKTNEPPLNLPPRRYRQSYDWPPEAEKLARQKPRIHPANLIRQLREMTDYPLDACWRFAHKFGIQRPTRYRSWPRWDQEKVLEMSETRPVSEIAKHFGVSVKAIYHIIAKNQRQVSRRSEWFGLHAIARYLTVKPARVRTWITTEKLKSVIETHGKLRYTMISGAALLKFCQDHKSELLRQRIPEKRILFLMDYVIAAEVSDDYTARSSKLERAAFERGEYLDQGSRRKEGQAHFTDEDDEEDEEMDSDE